MSRRNFSLAVKKQRLAHATGEDGNVRCEYCGLILTRSQWEFHHHLADYLGGKPTFENCRVLGNICCHPKESRKDKKLSAKCARIETVEIGAKLPTARPIVSRGFAKTAKCEKPKLDKLPIPQARSFSGCFKIGER